MLNPFNQIGQSTPFPRSNSNSSGGVIIEQPEFIRPFASETAVPVYPRLYATDFITDPPLAENHLNTDWQVATNNTFTSIAFESLADTTNKTDVLVTDELDASTLHYARLRYRGDGGGISLYSATRQFTTSANFQGVGAGEETPVWAARSVLPPIFITSNSRYAAVACRDGLIALTEDGINYFYICPVLNNFVNDVQSVHASISSENWCAVGQGGQISTSPDGINWILQTSGTISNLNGIAYGGGIYVVVGASGLVLTSSDGITWTSRTSGTANTLNGVAFDGNLFCACGLNGTIITSLDGVTWTTQTSGTANGLNDIRYINTLFCSVGASGTLITSPDGTAWTTRAVGVATALQGVAYGAGLYLVVGASNVVRSSPDLTTWTAQNPGLGTVTWIDAHYDSAKGGFLICSTASGFLTSSTDAVSWTNQRITNLRDPGLYSDIDSNLSRTVAIGGTGEVAYSDNGSVWVSYVLAGAGALDTLHISWADDTWFATGTSGNLRTSANAQIGTWTTQTTGVTTRLRSVASDGTTYVAAGETGTIITSTNLTSWTTRTSGTTLTFNSIVYAIGIFVAVGQTGAIFTSSDGITWTGRTSGTTNTFNDICWTGSSFVAVGASGTIRRSTDGITWNTENSGTTNALTGVVASNNVVLAIRGSNSAYSLDDGVSWTLVTGSAVFSRTNVTWNGQKFISVDNLTNGIIQASREIKRP